MSCDVLFKVGLLYWVEWVDLFYWLQHVFIWQQNLTFGLIFYLFITLGGTLMSCDVLFKVGLLYWVEWVDLFYWLQHVFILIWEHNLTFCLIF